MRVTAFFTALLLFPALVVADLIPVRVDIPSEDSAVLTFNTTSKLSPAISTDNRYILVASSNSLFTGDIAKSEGIIKAITQLTSNELTYLAINLNSPVIVRAEEGVNSQRITLIHDETGGESNRAAFSEDKFTISAKPSLDKLNIVLPGGFEQSYNPLAIQLRIVASVIDLVAQGFLVPNSLGGLESKSGKLDQLIGDLNTEVLELRHQNMLIEKELHSCAVKNNGAYVRK